MATVGSASGNSSISIKTYGDLTITTVNSTQVTAFSIPIAQNKAYRVKVIVLAYLSDFTKSNIGDVSGSFLRGTGDLIKDGALIRNMSGALSGAGIDLVANTSTESVDVKISGTSGTVIWDFAVELISNT